MIEKIEAVIKRMRWKVYWFLNGNESQDSKQENYGFKSRNTPAMCRELESFENDMIPYSYRGGGGVQCTTAVVFLL